MTGEERRSLILVQFQIQNVLCLSLQCWQHGENFLFLGGGPILVKMCVAYADPALVVPCDGTSLPDVGV